ncbi:MAG: hypothetical protein ACPG61_17335, partial [Paracoccaceae bacterium]
MSEFVENIRKAIDSLDRHNDDDWNKDGTPSVIRIRDLGNDPSITKADIEAARPGFTRPTTAEPSHGEEEQDGAPTTEDKAEGSDGKTGASDAPEVSASDAETNQTDDEGLGTDAAPMTMGDFMARGYLMAIIMRLPTAMRVLADINMLNDMTE